MSAQSKGILRREASDRGLCCETQTVSVWTVLRSHFDPHLAGGNMGGQLGFCADLSFPADPDREKSSDFGAI
jgi:hypothetical protein